MAVIEKSKFDHNFDVLNSGYNKHFYVENGNIKELKGSNFFHYLISKKFRTAIQKDLSNEISNLLVTLDKNLERDGEAHCKKYKSFIFEKLSPLSTQVFDRTILNKKECENLRILLDPDYEPVNEKKPNYTQDENYLDRIEAAAKFALKLGIRPESVGEGNSGTYFLRDLSKKRIAVFKPGDEEALSENSFKMGSRAKRVFLGLVRRIFNFCQTAVFCCSGRGYKAEVAASIMSKGLGLNNVPLTKITALAHPAFNYSSDQRKKGILPLKKGSFQLFVEGKNLALAEKTLKISHLWCSVPKLAERHFSAPHEVKRLNELLPQDEFERLAVIDIVIGNLDRHFRNWLLGKHAFGIDNGYAFAFKHSDSKVTGLNQYMWKFLPHANRTFSKTTKQRINQIKDQLPAIIRQLKTPQLGEMLITDQQIEKMCERIALLIYKQDKPIREIASCKTTQHFEDLKKDQAYLVILNEIKKAAGQ